MCQAVFSRAVALVRGDVEDVAADNIRINLFAEGTDGRLRERYWDDATWTWVDAGKPAVGGPLAIVRGNTNTVDPSPSGSIFVPVLQITASGGPALHWHFDIHLWERHGTAPPGPG